MVSQPGSVGYTIMGKTAAWTNAQKATDTLKKEDKLQRVTAKEVGCSQCAVSKHILRKLSERKKPVRKSLHLETGITSVLTGCPHCQKIPKAASMTTVLLCLIGQQTGLSCTCICENLRIKAWLGIVIKV
ncbi:hypothetical protein XENORESO_013453 [Xenotaenia resolanae]|uniref:Uncharacterized protein n=1 Tax=Xenotaenia resolanae TaxID=208358 RepID=A0ABV0WS58_9TELE